MASDWKYHKRDCHDADSPPILAPNHKLVDAIYFPDDEDRPYIVKVEVEVRDNHVESWPGIVYHKRLLEPWFGNEHQEQLSTKRRKGPKLVIAAKEAFRIDGSRLNQSVHKLTGPGAYPWAGPILAFRAEERDAKADRFEDALIEDLDHLRWYFAEYAKTTY